MLPIQLAEKMHKIDGEFGCFGMVSHMLDNPNRVQVCEISVRGKSNEPIAHVWYDNDGSIRVKGTVNGILRGLRCAKAAGLTGGPIDPLKVKP